MSSGKEEEDRQGGLVSGLPLYEERYRGSRFRGVGRKRCPNCGAHISHGLPGNPYLRARQPCEVIA